MIKNKFYCGQEVWFVSEYGNTINSEVGRIMICRDHNTDLYTSICYSLKYPSQDTLFKESELFATEKEAKEALLLSKGKLKVGDKCYSFFYDDGLKKPFNGIVKKISLNENKFFYHLLNYNEDRYLRTSEDNTFQSEAEAKEKCDVYNKDKEALLLNKAKFKVGDKAFFYFKEAHEVIEVTIKSFDFFYTQILYKIELHKYNTYLFFTEEDLLFKTKEECEAANGINHSKSRKFKNGDIVYFYFDSLKRIFKGKILPTSSRYIEDPYDVEILDEDDRIFGFGKFKERCLFFGNEGAYVFAAVINGVLSYPVVILYKSKDNRKIYHTEEECLKDNGEYLND